MDSKLLTISIPTWNRAFLLNDLLNSLSTGLIKYSLDDKIQILVSNNASEDNTRNVVNEYCSKFNFIEYYENDTNIGGKSNVLKSMELAQTDYVIFLGDDDKLNVENLKPAIEILESNKDIGVLLDSHNSKFKYAEKIKTIDAEELAKRFFWYMGNATHFIVRTEYFKTNLSKYGYDFFNECWPQTQIMLLGLQNSKNKCCVADLNIHNESVHGEVMIYTSFYLWRTCYYDLFLSINDIKDKISPEVYHSAMLYMKKSLGQQLFNILQCGIFTDEPEVRGKTAKHILKQLHLFSLYEKTILWIIIIALSLPTRVSKPLSNIFIFCIKGKSGIKKKNDFVHNELSKKRRHQTNKASIRTLEFEK